MKWRYILLLALMGCLLYLANTNPEKGEYTKWASEQLIQGSDLHKALSKTEQEDAGSLFGELASLGKQLTEKYVQPQVGLLIEKYTTKKDYIFFSTYTTSFTIGGTTYTYVTVGVADRFVPVQVPEQTKKEGA